MLVSGSTLRLILTPNHTTHHNMNIIIPMAGRGTRLRPHTLTVPKPLIPVAGKPIIQRLVESLTESYSGKIGEIAFVVGDFGPEVERELIGIAEALGAKGRIYHQKKALGVGHAIHCAWESLTGPCMIAFADTLFKADFQFDTQEAGFIWVQKVKDPSSFGVVKLDTAGYVTDFVEKPTVFVSDLAIVGIYYFREGEKLRAALHQVVTREIDDATPADRSLLRHIVRDLEQVVGVYATVRRPGMVRLDDPVLLSSADAATSSSTEGGDSL